MKLRSTLDAIYANSLQDLRTQSNRVNSALAEKITLTEQICERLEKELLRVRNFEIVLLSTFTYSRNLRLVRVRTKRFVSLLHFKVLNFQFSILIRILICNISSRSCITNRFRTRAQ